MFLNLKSYYEITGEDIDKNIPLTFLIQVSNKSEEMQAFCNHYEDNMTNDRDNRWILKPGEFTNRGKGIKISQRYNSIEKYVNSSERDWSIVQKYIHNPLLINNGSGGNRKFDIRCFALYTCFNNQPKVYFFQDGYLRTASKEFSDVDINNKYIHLTNDAIQK